MNIEHIKSLLAKATPGPIELTRYAHGGGRAFSGRELVADFFSEGDRELYTAARAAFPALLKVAEAAKAYHDMATSRYDSSRVAEFERKQDALGAALAELEAQ